MSERTSKPIHVALCLDAGVYFRYRAVLRHLSVGLIDEVSSVRLLTSAKQAQALSLGPVQVTLYEELHWPLAHRRMRQMLEGIRDDPPSVVHAMSANSYPVAEAVATEFDADLVYQITALEDIDACVGSTHTGPKRVICASQPLLDRYLAATREPPELAGLIRPGVVCTSEPTCFLETDRDPTLLTTADLVPHAGVDQLIQAVALLRDRGHQLLAFLLGGGPEEHRLRELCQRLKLAATVVFAQPAGTALKAMVGADIFVQPGVEHAISARSLQALGQGMAVVGVRGGVHDAYVPDETALLVERSEASLLADAIEQLLKNHARAQALAEGAIAHMKKHHTMSAMAEKTGAVYREMALHRATFPLPRRSG